MVTSVGAVYISGVVSGGLDWTRFGGVSWTTLMVMAIDFSGLVFFDALVTYLEYTPF